MARQWVESEVQGTVWEVQAGIGDSVGAGEALLVLESMKMEIPVEAPVAGVVAEILVGKGDSVEEGQRLAAIEVT